MEPALYYYTNYKGALGPTSIFLKSLVMESAQRAPAGKKTLWQSICSNPKVVFIALFAS